MQVGEGRELGRRGLRMTGLWGVPSGVPTHPHSQGSPNPGEAEHRTVSPGMLSRGSVALGRTTYGLSSV